jgi:hypothetical protein
MILLDTHAWIWWASQSPNLSAAQAIAQETEIGVAAISCWEVAMLVNKSRLTLRAEVSRSGVCLLCDFQSHARAGASSMSQRQIFERHESFEMHAHLREAPAASLAQFFAREHACRLPAALLALVIHQLADEADQTPRLRRQLIKLTPEDFRGELICQRDVFEGDFDKLDSAAGTAAQWTDFSGRFLGNLIPTRLWGTLIIQIRGRAIPIADPQVLDISVRHGGLRLASAQGVKRF